MRYAFVCANGSPSLCISRAILSKVLCISRFHANQAGCPIGKVLQKSLTLELLTHDLFSFPIDPVQLNTRFSVSTPTTVLLILMSVPLLPAATGTVGISCSVLRGGVHTIFARMRYYPLIVPARAD